MQQQQLSYRQNFMAVCTLQRRASIYLPHSPTTTPLAQCGAVTSPANTKLVLLFSSFFDSPPLAHALSQSLPLLINRIELVPGIQLIQEAVRMLHQGYFAYYFRYISNDC